jgi:hypothetical protein
VLVGAHTKRNEVKKKSIEGQDCGGGFRSRGAGEGFEDGSRRKGEERG